MANITTLNTFISDDNSLMLLQKQWIPQLNGLLRNPSLQSTILQKVSLHAGPNTINHLLSRNLQGWRIVRQRAQASIYDTQDSNPSPNLTLILVSSATVEVDIEVF